jgi:hypothetical protein
MTLRTLAHPTNPDFHCLVEAWSAVAERHNAEMGGTKTRSASVPCLASSVWGQFPINPDFSTHLFAKCRAV